MIALVISGLDGEHLRLVLASFGHDDQGRGPLALDIELDAPQVLDRHIEHQAFGVRHCQSTIGDDHERVAERRLDADLFARLEDAECWMVVHRHIMDRRDLRWR